MKFDANLTLSIFKQGRRFVAYSPALDIATSGKTDVEVKKRFSELVNIFFEELEDMGTTEDVLSELGWKKQKVSTKLNQWLPPLTSSSFIKINTPVTA